ncbi:MAG: DUF6084 family protein [Solirubrobacteraceae bacterium]
MSVDSLDVGQVGQRLTPEPMFDVTAASHLPFAAAPTMVFATSASEAAGSAIESMSLQVQLMIDPARRGYDADTRGRLAELFGPPATWTPSTQGLSWARVTASVPRFVGETSFTLEVPCTYDLEVAAAKYFYALEDGLVPLSFHFYGTIFYRASDGRLQMTPVPWSSTAQFSMPITEWQAMIAEHYPGGGWVRVGASTLRALNARRATRGLTFDRCIEELLDGA